jgi:hypothetical protein
VDQQERRRAVRGDEVVHAQTGCDERKLPRVLGVEQARRHRHDGETQRTDAMPDAKPTDDVDGATTNECVGG